MEKVNPQELKLTKCASIDLTFVVIPPDICYFTSLPHLPCYPHEIAKSPLAGTLCGQRIDDEIYEDAIATFPEFAEPPHSKLVKLDEDWMKSSDGKKRWREFMER